MNKSREYIFKLSVAQRTELARKVGVSGSQYLCSIGSGRRSPSRKLAARLELATSGKVKAADFEREALQSVSVSMKKF